MSRTDKDRPWWVQNFQDGPELYDHDHSRGECIEETLEYAKYSAGHSGWGHGRHHNRRCAKRVTVEYTCTKDDPNTHSWYNWVKRGSFSRQTCWTWRCECPIPDEWRREHHACENLRRVACIGHTRTEWDNSIPCVCDDFPARPTCSRTRSEAGKGGYRRYTWGGVPTEFINTYYHRPERARERKLNDYVREYNTYGELEDGDFENRQARNSARWLYW